MQDSQEGRVVSFHVTEPSCFKLVDLTVFTAAKLPGHRRPP